MLQKELEIDFQKYWLVLQRHWLLAPTVFGLTTAAASLGSTQEPLYKAEAKLLFESSETIDNIVGLDTGDRLLSRFTRNLSKNRQRRPNALRLSAARRDSQLARCAPPATAS